ncbi:methionine gamma-lyase family protein [Bombilactobacillus thymidiniphilus]|uniref:Methionine gamma-lyase family protein n=1 Tax=Bombilactobacillus thymidiniphilus TaxID=2923363 RepID=A0ABY4PCX6_9LACO|nr:methionine gamma-lyase family protein [Bombilactobacillus thymidiniphilus]UQS83392.1 methionine gamma-lyase family protein [Bombilactobacillus thymidiniphilus]
MNWMADLPEKVQKAIVEVDQQIQPQIAEIDRRMDNNQAKVLQAFMDQQVAESHLNGSTGYGNNDEGREVLDKVYAQVFATQAALVRPQFVSGTHTLAVGLFGCLHPGQKLLYITGKPYDTMQEVIGMTGSGVGSLQEYGIKFDYQELNQQGKVDYEHLGNKLTDFKPDVIAIQRSRGYDPRPSFTVAEIAEMITFVRQFVPQTIVFVDNCYGEFSEETEPSQVGADLIAGSLFKNAGAGLATTGGYLAGRQDLIERCAIRLTAPGIGLHEGATGNNLRWMIEGFFLAPQATGNAIKGAIFAAALLEKFDFDVTPKYDEPRTDLIQTVILGTADKMVQFAKAIQKYSPIDSFVAPEPSSMVGYEDQIVMAAGTFVQGSTIELSADGPLRSPYAIYLQGGLTYQHVRIAVSHACADIL